jgi:hypothetical protein
MSSERQPRPFLDQFQELMDPTMSCLWWTEAIAGCRAALAESAALRLEFDLIKKGRSAEEIADPPCGEIRALARPTQAAAAVIVFHWPRPVASELALTLTSHRVPEVPELSPDQRQATSSAGAYDLAGLQELLGELPSAHNHH